MDLGLRGKVAIVCASSKGLGFAIARQLAREGASVAMCSRDSSAIQSAAERVQEEAKVPVLAESCDLTRVDDIQRFVRHVGDRFGSIDILVNNTGGPKLGTFDSLTDEDWIAGFNLVLLSVVRMVREVLPWMRKTGRGGRIINVTSYTMKEPAPNLILSNAYRSALVGLAKTLANELGKEQILVNTMAQGRFQTERVRSIDQAAAERSDKSYEQLLRDEASKIPLGRYGDPDELAKVVAFLASDGGSYVTGATISVDGGLVRALM